MKRHVTWWVLRFLMVVGCFAGVVGIEGLLIKSTERGTREERLFLPDGRMLKRASFGHNHALADLYWLRAIQYYGEPEHEKEGYRWLYPLLSLITDLDPLYDTPYRWGGVVLPFFNGTNWLNVKESNALLKLSLIHI
mgnify:CR=1 FL=1